MRAGRLILIAVATAFIAGCDSDLFTFSSSLLHGTWQTELQATQPSGSFNRELILSPSGRYVETVRSRGVIADQVLSFTSMYGTYTFDGDTLRMREDSSRGWEPHSGEWRQGRPMYIEGAPTDRAVELNRNTLVLRFFVDPGAGYVPVRITYHRAR